MTKTFLEKLREQNAEGRFACAGLDPVEGKMPQDPWRDTLERLGQAARCDAAAFKPNWAFYLQRNAGLDLLREVCRSLRDIAPGVLIILDMKCGDIDKTNVQYAKWAFEACRVDAITVHSYTGSQAMAPFLQNPNRGVFVLCRTSNEGAAEMQNAELKSGLTYYQYVAKTVSTVWNMNKNCGLVVGATYPDELAKVRDIAPELPLLIPGVGDQKGDLEKTLAAATRRKPLAPFVINQSGSFMNQPTLDASVAKLREVNEAAQKAVLAA